jgi:hypothetical protein
MLTLRGKTRISLSKGFPAIGLRYQTVCFRNKLGVWDCDTLVELVFLALNKLPNG